MKPALAVCGLLLLASSARAEPLCRDLKGLLAPCAANRIGPASRAPASPTAALARPGPARHRSERFRLGRLCRDTKGLTTPCA